MQNSYVLYMSLRSPFARRVRLVLEELGLEYRTEVVDVLNPPAWLVQVNPLLRIPVLRFPMGQLVTESSEILDALRERNSGHPIFDRGGADEFRLRHVTAMSLGIMEHVVQAFLETQRPPGMQPADWREDQLERVRNALESVAGQLQGPFVAGERVTVWDFDLVTAIEYCDLRLGRAFVDRHPGLRAYHERLCRRPAFAKTAPPA